MKLEERIKQVEEHIEKVRSKEKTPFKELDDWVYKCTGCSSCQGFYRENPPLHPPIEHWRGEQTYDQTCPIMSGSRFEVETPSGLLWSIKGYLEGIIPMKEEALERLFKCTSCAACEYECYGDHGEKISKIIRSVRENQIKEGKVPPKIRDFLENIYVTNNPWGSPKSRRMEWSKELDNIKEYDSDDEYLYYVGCVGSYDEYSQTMTSNTYTLLNKAGISFGILSDEICDGAEVNQIGETGLYEELARQNIEKFKNLGVKKIVALSPHAYDVFKNEYPFEEKYPEFEEVIHYTQLLSEVIQEGKLNTGNYEAKVTYHDPCYLGRHNDIYEEPRDVLKSIDGIELIEMRRTKNRSFCCGGATGNFYTDMISSSVGNASRDRIIEAYENDAEILAVSCPICMTMLKDAVKQENLEKELAVMDISEIVIKSL